MAVRYINLKNTHKAKTQISLHSDYSESSYFHVGFLSIHRLIMQNRNAQSYADLNQNMFPCTLFSYIDHLSADQDLAKMVLMKGRNVCFH